MPQNEDKMHWLALGDSYTIGQGVTLQERYPNQTNAILLAQNILYNTPEIIAVTGWTTSNLINALNNYTPIQPKYDVVTLLIGVNNQYQGRSLQEYNTECTQLAQRAIGYAGGVTKHVTILSIPDWSVTPFAAGQNTQQIATEIDSFNAINKRIALQYNMNYIDITPSTRMAATDPSLVAADRLHPSGLEYAKWAARLAVTIKQNK